MSSEYQTSYRLSHYDDAKTVHSSEFMASWDKLKREDLRKVSEALSYADTREEFLSVVFNPDDAVLAGSEETVARFGRDLEFTEELDLLGNYATAEDVAGKHVLGHIPLYLEAEAETVTVHAVTGHLGNRPEGYLPWTAEEFDAMPRKLVTYEVERLELDPVDLRKDRLTVVTEDPGLVEELKERGIIDDTVPVLDRLDDPRALRGRILVGEGSVEMNLKADAVVDLDPDGNAGVYAASPLMIYPASGDDKASAYGATAFFMVEYGLERSGDQVVLDHLEHDSRAWYRERGYVWKAMQDSVERAKYLLDRQDQEPSYPSRDVVVDRVNDALVTNLVMQRYYNGGQVADCSVQDQLRALYFLNVNEDVLGENRKLVEELKHGVFYGLREEGVLAGGDVPDNSLRYPDDRVSFDQFSRMVDECKLHNASRSIAERVKNRWREAS